MKNNTNISIKNEKIELEVIIYKDIDYNLLIIKIKNYINNNIKFIEIYNKLYENEFRNVL